METQNTIQSNIPTIPQNHNLPSKLEESVSEIVKEIPSLFREYIASQEKKELWNIDTNKEIEIAKITNDDVKDKRNSRNLFLYILIIVCINIFYEVNHYNIANMQLILSFGFSYFLFANKNVSHLIDKISKTLKKDID